MTMRPLKLKCCPPVSDIPSVLIWLRVVVVLSDVLEWVVWLFYHSFVLLLMIYLCELDQEMFIFVV